MSAIEPLLWLALTLVAYTYAGYPLLLLACSRRATHAAGTPVDAPRPPVTLIMAARDEVQRIDRKLDSIFASRYPAAALRVIVVSDGSTDGTPERVKARGDARVLLLESPVQRGKAACLNQAVAAADTDILIMLDVRQTLDPGAVGHLVDALRDPGLGAVSGELVFRDDSPTGFSRGVDLYWRYEKWIRLMESGWRSVIGVTGAIYALRRSAWQALPPDIVLDDVLVPMRCVMAGWRVGFEPAAIAFDVPSRSAAQERLRKVRTLAGNWQLLALEPWLLAPWRNPVALEFWSHKVLRLLAPWLLAIVLACSAFLAAGSALYFSLWLAQLAFYGLAGLGLLVRPLQALAAVRVPLAFVQLNGFAVLGLFEFLRNRNAHLWR